jgi:hypothetical protein
MGEVAIDWSSATVTVEEDYGLHLKVRLNREPDSTWKNEFKRLRDRQITTPGLGERLIASTATFGNEVTAAGIRPGHEESVRDALNHMVHAANLAAAEARDTFREGKRAEEEAAREREQAARDMTERFRAGGTLESGHARARKPPH